MVRYWNGAVWTETVAPAAPVAPSAPAAPMYGAPLQQQPYAQPTGPTTPDGQRIAGWWWRVGAYLIDGLALGGVSQVVMLPFTLGFNQDLMDLVDEWEAADSVGTLDGSRVFDDLFDVFQDNALSFAIPSLLTSLLYFVLMWRFVGATLGQLALGLRVRLRERPGKPSWTTATVRWFVLAGIGSLSWFAVLASWQLAIAVTLGAWLFFLVNVLWATWDPQRQALHDKAARTNVVRVR